VASKVFIIGNNVRVAHDVENFTAVGCEDVDIDSSYNNKTSIQNDAIVVSNTGIELNQSVSTPVYIPVTDGRVTITADFFTVATRKIYFIDSTSGNINGSLLDTGITYIFVKTKAANNVILTPDTGTINGAATYTLTAIRETITVAFDGTDWYII
jgi:hypothetical protein